MTVPKRVSRVKVQWTMSQRTQRELLFKLGNSRSLSNDTKTDPTKSRAHYLYTTLVLFLSALRYLWRFNKSRNNYWSPRPVIKSLLKETISLSKNNYWCLKKCSRPGYDSFCNNVVAMVYRFRASRPGVELYQSTFFVEGRGSYLLLYSQRPRYM